MEHTSKLAYIIGVSLGDGNLSNPNGRAVRLRITCDNKYPKIIEEITRTLQYIFPDNKIGLVNRKNCSDVSVYSNRLKSLLPWSPGNGSKYEQSARVPPWIIGNDDFSRSCLRGLITTDGSIYEDRGYLMVNFATNIWPLAYDVITMIKALGYKPTLSTTPQPSGKPKHTVRVSRDVKRFLKEIKLRRKY